MSQTIQNFIDKHQLETKERVRVPANPNVTDDEWARTATHWAIAIRQVGFGNPRVFNTHFSQGSAHQFAPKLRDVLESLRMEASGVQDSSFEDWAAELGYDTDSRKAERIYNVVREQAALLRAFLGDELYREFLQCEEE